MSRFVERYGPVAVVTGASDGIGRACAEELARRGLGLVVVARNRDGLEAVAASLERSFAARVQVIAADLATAEGCAAVLRETEHLDVGLLVAAAGYGTSGTFLASELDRELDMLALNCGAILRLTHGFGRRLAARGRGGLILFGSLVGFQGVPFAAHYAATKAWNQTLAEGLAAEFRAAGVDVLSSAPGPVASGFAARADMRMGAAVTPATVAQQTLAALGRRTTVRPGWLSKLLEASLATLPRSARTRIMAQVMRGMTKHQHERVIGGQSGPA